MGQLVVATAQIKCSFGVAPVPLVVVPKGPPVMIGKLPAATIMDFAPIANIATFGMCMAPTNPAVIAATSAAMGVFTPAPCVPVTTSPWMPGSPTCMINKFPALTSTSQCLCTWLGVITVVSPGQFTTTAP